MRDREGGGERKRKRDKMDINLKVEENLNEDNSLLNCKVHISLVSDMDNPLGNNQMKNKSEIDTEDFKMNFSCEKKQEINKVLYVKLIRIDELMNRFKDNSMHGNKLQILSPSKINSKLLEEAITSYEHDAEGKLQDLCLNSEEVERKPEIHMVQKENQSCNFPISLGVDCILCQARFDNRLELHKHVVITHANTKIYFCDSCDSTFLDEKTLQRHKDIAHPALSIKQSDVKEKRPRGRPRKKPRPGRPPLLRNKIPKEDVDVKNIDIIQLQNKNIQKYLSDSLNTPKAEKVKREKEFIRHVSRRTKRACTLKPKIGCCVSCAEGKLSKHRYPLVEIPSKKAKKKGKRKHKKQSEYKILNARQESFMKPELDLNDAEDIVGPLTRTENVRQYQKVNKKSTSEYFNEKYVDTETDGIIGKKRIVTTFNRINTVIEPLELNVSMEDDVETASIKIENIASKDQENEEDVHQNIRIDTTDTRTVRPTNLSKAPSLRRQRRNIRRVLGMCLTCKEVYSLMNQLKAKREAEGYQRRSVNCPFCKLYFISLFYLQQHIADVHLQCEGKSSSATGKRFEIEIVNEKSMDCTKNELLVFECCCCPKEFNNVETFNEHIQKFHCKSGINITDNRDEQNSSCKGTEREDRNTVLPNSRSDGDTNNLRNGKSSVENAKVSYTIVRKFGRSKTEDKDLYIKLHHLNTDNVLKNDATKNVSKSMRKIFNSLLSSEKRKNHDEVSSQFFCMICSKEFKEEAELLWHAKEHVTISDFDDHDHETFSTDEEEMASMNSYREEDKEREEEEEEKGEEKEEGEDDDEDERKQEIGGTVKRYKLISDSGDQSDITFEEISDSSELTKIGVDAKKRMNEHHNDEYILPNSTTIDKNNSMESRNFSNSNRTKRLKHDSGVKLMNSKKKKEGEMATSSSTDGEINCNLCNKRFYCQRIFREHMYFVHDAVLEDTVVSDLLTPYFNDGDEDIHKISDENFICLTRIKEPRQYRGKRKISEGGESYKKNCLMKKKKQWYCTSCHTNFDLIGDLIRHKYYHHNDDSVVHICENCDKVLTSVAMANMHVCTTVRFWSCNRCNVDFSDGLLLRQHNIDHHFEYIGPHPCNACERNFLTISMLERHKLSNHIYNHNDSNNLEHSTCMI